jgi:diguanylate cyclase (GGDEF)-like protein
VLTLACDAGALVMLARAAGASCFPQTRSDLPMVALLEPAVLIGLFATSAAASVGFLLLHRERAEIGLRRLAAFDPLTEVFNRLAFLGLAEAQLARARRSGEPCALLMLALDPYRHPEGRKRRETNERVLRELAAILRGALRAGDMVGRYATEEFCILLSNSAPASVIEVAERLRSTVAARRLGELAPAVTVTIGVAHCEPRRAGALHVALAYAEQALRRARKAGRDRVAAAPAAFAPTSGTRRAA